MAPPAHRVPAKLMPYAEDQAPTHKLQVKEGARRILFFCHSHSRYNDISNAYLLVLSKAVSTIECFTPFLPIKKLFQLCRKL